MCCIIDGMDQSKLLLPSLIQTAKGYASAWRLKTHLTGTAIIPNKRTPSTFLLIRALQGPLLLFG